MIYKMQIPPFPVKSFDLLTTRQAKEIFKWYTDDIPARLDQLQKCIDADVNGTVQLTRGKDSLRPLWSWLVANIQLQELTESDLKESLDAVPKWLHEYIVAGKYKLTTESLSIGMDVAIYLGEVFVHEFPQIYWGFFRFLYKGIIIKHNKTEPTYTKTSLFLCEKRRFLWPGLRKEGNLFKLAGPGGLAFFHLTKKEVSKWPMKK